LNVLIKPNRSALGDLDVSTERAKAKSVERVASGARDGEANVVFHFSFEAVLFQVAVLQEECPAGQ
jgi:hypothetical protein